MLHRAPGAIADFQIPQKAESEKDSAKGRKRESSGENSTQASWQGARRARLRDIFWNVFRDRENPGTRDFYEEAGGH